MVTYCATKLTAACSSMIGQFFDTMICMNRQRVVVMTQQSWKVVETVSSHLKSTVTLSRDRTARDLNVHVKQPSWLQTSVSSYAKTLIVEEKCFITALESLSQEFVYLLP